MALTLETPVFTQSGEYSKSKSDSDSDGDGTDGRLDATNHESPLAVDAAAPGGGPGMPGDALDDPAVVPALRPHQRVLPGGSWRPV